MRSTERVAQICGLNECLSLKKKKKCAVIMERNHSKSYQSEDLLSRCVFMLEAMYFSFLFC